MVEVDLMPVLLQISRTVGGNPEDICLTIKLYTLCCFSFKGRLDKDSTPNEHLFGYSITLFKIFFKR
jgi:hypothetical protein